MSPSKRVPVARRRITARILRAQGRLEEAAVQAQLELLAEIRRALLQALGEASGFQVFHYSRLLAEVDLQVERLRVLGARLAVQSGAAAFNAGGSMVTELLTQVGVGIGPGLSSQLLDATIAVTTEQLTSVWIELGSSLRTTIRQAALGVQDPFQAIRNIAARIRDPKTFGRAEFRAEAIVRTEVGRTFSLAGQERLAQANARMGGGLRKYWLSAEDERVRPTHAAADEAYRPGGSIGPIPVDQPFIVGGYKLMQPLDPQGPPKETINCRCVSVPYVEDLVADVAA